MSNKADSEKAIIKAIQPPSRRDFGYFLSLTLERSGRADGNIDLEPQSYVVPITARINSLDAEEHTSVVGEIYAELIELDRASRVGVAPYNIFDSDGRLWEYYEGLTQDCEDITDAIESVCPDGVCFSYDVLLLSTIQIKPPHRRNRLGLYAMAGLIDLFQDHCSIALMQPFPMQFGPAGEEKRWMRRFGKGLAGEQQSAQLTLQNYWKQLGFKQFGDTRFFVLTLENFDLRKLFVQRR